MLITVTKIPQPQYSWTTRKRLRVDLQEDNEEIPDSCYTFVTVLCSTLCIHVVWKRVDTDV